MGALVTATDDASTQKLDNFEMVVLGSGGGSGTTTVAYIHPDHLSGSNAITNDSDELVQTLDYYPFGCLRVNKQDANFNERKKFTGYEFDSSTGLNYANARYQNPDQGRFISQDPVFQNVGVDNRTKTVLLDPQQLNSYSYSRNNPLVYTDPNGEIAFPALLLGIISVYGQISNLIDAYEFKTVVLDYPEYHSIDQINQTGNKVLWDIFTFGIGRIATDIERATLDVATAALDVLDHYFAPQVYQNVNYKQLQSQTTIQARQNFVQSYNASTNVSTPQSQLWVTPSGAVVNWGGQLITGPADEN